MSEPISLTTVRIAATAEAPMQLTLAQAAAWLPQARLIGDPATVIARVHTDTRTLRAGDLFVALRGERFDAHDFLPQAAASGAVAVLAERGVAGCGLPGLEVADSLVALQQLSAAWRAQFDLPLIAVTGSNGKTTVTQMIASILRAWHGDAALATQGNLNNHIGVPMTLLRLRPQHRVAVVELGMNHPGEIDVLARLAQPTVALVNNAQREHQEFMKTVEAVARENGSVLAHLPPQGTAVFPAGDTYSALWRELAGGRPVLDFGLDSAAAPALHLTADWALTHWQAVLHTPAGEVRCALHPAGRHNLRNALAAASCALAAGCPLAAVQAGLAAFRPVSGRSQVEAGCWQGRAVTLVNDSYNANPDSVRAAIDVLAELPGPRWLLLGDMGEVGDQGPEFHAEIGAYAAERGIERVWTAGTLAAHAAEACRSRLPGDRAADAVRHHQATADLVAALQHDNAARHGSAVASVLVKGSRFMKMEQAVAVLRAPQDGSCGPEVAHAG